MSASIDRRQFLIGAAGSAFGASAVAQESVPTTKPPSPESSRRSSHNSEGPMSAVVTLGGKTFTFRETDGEDLGDFEGPGFVQRCVRVTRPDVPLTVFFRPDRNSDRAEVVFELGRLWGEANRNAANLEGYHARIERGDRIIAEGRVPKHWWFSAWRWQSALRPVIRRTADLMKEGLLLPFDDRLARFAEPAKRIRYGGPMDNAGIYTAMGTTGERPDIGPVTELQGEYIVTGNRAALGSLLIQGEAAGSVPWHMRDENTGAPIDFYAHPKAHWNYRSEPNTEHIKCTKSEWTVDDAHQPALAYLPYLLTGDPFHLEQLQFQGAYNVGWGLYHRALQGLPVLYPGQTRSYAWSLRTLAQLARVTPEKTPKWLLPRAYWKRMLDDNLLYFTRTFVDDSKPASSVFRAATSQESVASWQECFLAVAIGWAVRLGFSDWRKAFEWKIGSTIALSDGRSGWPRQWCSPYYYKIKDPVSGAFHRSWKDLWDGFKADPANKVVAPFADRNSWAQSNSVGYLFYTRGALALATQLGIGEARDCFEFVDAMTVEELSKRKGGMIYRWAMAGA